MRRWTIAMFDQNEVTGLVVETELTWSSRVAARLPRDDLAAGGVLPQVSVAGSVMAVIRRFEPISGLPCSREWVLASTGSIG
jgi:hypothetical protein